MKIGVLSDTHGWLDPKIFEYFKDCHEVWHAGDIGEGILPLFDQFSRFRAVYGNIDGQELRCRYPDFQTFKCQDMRVLMTHIGGVPPTYTSAIREKFKVEMPDILVCGHSHILRVMRDPYHHSLLYLNPGAAGKYGFHHMRTLLRFEIEQRKIINMEVIELGLRHVV